MHFSTHLFCFRTLLHPKNTRNISVQMTILCLQYNDAFNLETISRCTYNSNIVYATLLYIVINCYQISYFNKKHLVSLANGKSCKFIMQLHHHDYTKWISDLTMFCKYVVYVVIHSHYVFISLCLITVAVTYRSL